MKNRLLFQQDLSLLVKAGFFLKKDYAAWYKETLVAVKRIEKRAEEGHFPFLEAPFLPFEDFSGLLKRFEHVRMILVLGAPSSTLTIRAFASLLQSWVWADSGHPRLCFLDALDPEIFWEVMSVAHPSTTGVLVFSQSGENTATLLQLMRCLEYWHGLINTTDLRNHFLAITSPHPSRLREIATLFSFSCLDYPWTGPPGFGCFSPIMLLPVLMAGFNAQKFNEGAALTCAQFFKGILKIPLEAMACLMMGFRHHGIGRHVLWAFGDIFQSLMQWMVQTGYPTLSVNSVTPSHRAFFTVFFERHVARERLAPIFWKALPSLKTLAQTPLVDQVEHMCKHFCAQKITEGHFLRVVQVNTLNEETMGALLMNHLIETLIIKDMDEFSSGKLS